MKILITGGAGYIGSTLAPMLLEQGHQVKILDSLMYGGESMLGFWSHPGFSFVQGDIRDAAVVTEALSGMDAVVHLAAIVGDPACQQSPELAKSVNLEGSLLLVEKSRELGIKRFIFASTCSNYGRMADPTQYVDENSELRPVSLYAETKVEVEQRTLDLPPQPDFCPTLIRLATVFGAAARMRFDLTVNEFTAELILKKRLVIFGEQFWRPYVHVRDVARAVSLILGSAPDKISGQVFNVGSTQENYQKKQLADLIHPYAPDAAIEYVHKQEDPRDYRVSFSKIQQTLGYEITRTVPDGIREIAQLIEAGIVSDYTSLRYRNVMPSP